MPIVSPKTITPTPKTTIESHSPKHRGNIMTDYDKVLKILFLGDKDVGKTQIMFK